MRIPDLGKGGTLATHLFRVHLQVPRSLVSGFCFRPPPRSPPHPPSLTWDPPPSGVRHRTHPAPPPRVKSKLKRNLTGTLFQGLAHWNPFNKKQRHTEAVAHPRRDGDYILQSSAILHPWGGKTGASSQRSGVHLWTFEKKGARTNRVISSTKGTMEEKDKETKDKRGGRNMHSTKNVGSDKGRTHYVICDVHTEHAVTEHLLHPDPHLRRQ